jgi:hypothetical protein
MTVDQLVAGTRSDPRGRAAQQHAEIREAGLPRQVGQPAPPLLDLAQVALRAGTRPRERDPSVMPSRERVQPPERTRDAAQRLRTLRRGHVGQRGPGNVGLEGEIPARRRPAAVHRPREQLWDRQLSRAQVATVHDARQQRRGTREHLGHDTRPRRCAHDHGRRARATRVRERRVAPVGAQLPTHVVDKPGECFGVAEQRLPRRSRDLGRSERRGRLFTCLGQDRPRWAVRVTRRRPA